MITTIVTIKDPNAGHVVIEVPNPDALRGFVPAIIDAYQAEYFGNQYEVSTFQAKVYYFEDTGRAMAFAKYAATRCPRAEVRVANVTHILTTEPAPVVISQVTERGVLPL